MTWPATTLPRRLPRPWLMMSLLVLVMAPACRPTTERASFTSLYATWKFQPGDDLRWAEPSFDDRGWAELQVPKSWGRQGYDHVVGMAWYRTRAAVHLPVGEPVGLALGKIDSAYEVFVGGRRLGGVGQLPPTPVMQYDRHRVYVVPAAAREPDGSVAIALRVWRAAGKSPGAAGPVEGPFEVGPITRVIERDLFAESTQLGLVLLFGAVGAFHLGLRALRRGTSSYGWFGLLAFESAIYSFLRTQWKYVLFDDFVTLKKIEHLMIYLVPVTFVQFLWIFLERPIPKPVRVLQAGLLVTGAFVMASPGLGMALYVLPYAQIAALSAAAAGIVFVLPFIRDGDPEARLLGIGALVLVLTIGSDLFVERNYIVAPRIVVYGFAVLVFGMSFALANRFHRVLGEADGLRRDLAQRVEVRTQELSAAYSKMEALALRDGLTGMLNRRALLDRAHAGLARARRQQAPFALAMIDVDHFKAINDTHGHLVGDQVLEHVAKQLMAGLRVSDDVGRWGGEEFLALLPEADVREATAAAERLLMQVRQFAFPGARGPIAVTVSIGVAAVAPAAVADARVDDLIREADEALYRAKHRGRNRAECGVVAGGVPPQPPAG